MIPGWHDASILILHWVHTFLSTSFLSVMAYLLLICLPEILHNSSAVADELSVLDGFVELAIKKGQLR